MTLTCGRSSGGSTLTYAVEPVWESASPSANDAPTTGMPTTLIVTRPDY